MRARLSVTLSVLLLSGCVYEDVCVAGAKRDPVSGRCARVGTDGGTDGGVVDGGVDAGVDAGGIDGGEPEAGFDAGPPPRIVQFSVGAASVCAIDGVGTLRCWGNNELGQLASGDVATFGVPRVVELGASVAAVGGNMVTSCARTSAPGLFCWGGNSAGQVGNGVVSDVPVTTPFEHTTVTAGRHIAASFANACVTSSFGSTVCWGRDDSGQLGTGLVSLVPQAVPGDSVHIDATSPLEGVTAVTVADRHVCLRAGLTLWCMGENGGGELGLGDTADREFATPVPGMVMVTSVSSAGLHTCAVNAGDVYCWGNNMHGEAGPVPGVITSPTLVPGTHGATQVWTGDSESCAVLGTGGVVCWGSRAHGGIGDGTPAGSTTTAAPVDVVGLSDVVAIDGSYLDLVCALTSAGELYCWGEDAIALIGTIPMGGTSVFLDAETIHTAPVRVDPLR